MKPIFRWTIGGTNKNGYECLKHSIDSILEIYGEIFEYYILYNNSNIQIIREIIGHRPITAISQNWSDCPIPIDYNKNLGTSMWKFCPSRLNIKSHEIICDNDIVFIKKIRQIDEFLLNKNSILLVEDPIKCQGEFRHLFKGNERYNAGFIGLPPDYDLEINIKKVWQENGSLKIITQRDEQGLSTATLKQEKFILVSKEDILLVHSDGATASSLHDFDTGKNNIKCHKINFFEQKAKAYHFVGLNKKNKHFHWELFKKKLNNILIL